MKKLIALGIFSLAYLNIKGQDIDTLSSLKASAKSYIDNKILHPTTYKSLGWSEIFKSDKELRLLNVFTARNSKGVIAKYAYNFKFDTELNLISVNTDPITKQLAELKREIQQAEEEKKRINDAADIQIKALKKNNPN